MSADVVNHLINVFEAIVLAYIAYLGHKNAAAQAENHKLLNSHLTAYKEDKDRTSQALQDLAYRRGQDDGPTASKLSPSPLESRVGPNHLNAGPTDRPV
jgi:hypothetical protein